MSKNTRFMASLFGALKTAEKKKPGKLTFSFDGKTILATERRKKKTRLE